MTDARPLVLILTASMGAGHTAVAEELARRLRSRGFRVEVVDLLEVLPGPIGGGLRAGYAAMLRWMPWLYQAIYRVWFAPRRQRAATVSPVTCAGARAVQERVGHAEPVAVVSTFHLCSRILGNLRRAGLVAVPTATMIVDFAVHRLWVDPAVDLHLCLHPSMAQEARRRGAGLVTAPGPVVRCRFVDSVWDRGSARRSLGVTEQERAVLIVTGSWGLSDLQAATAILGRIRGITPLVVCGTDDRLRRTLTGFRSTSRNARIMGWVADMDRLMLAADVVVENAGGLSCMEALAAGRPVVSFNPIPGHGRANVEAMARCGIVEHALRAQDLVDAVTRVAVPTPQRARRLQAAAEMFRGDPADDLVVNLGIRQTSCVQSP